jgi:hypothetical protein
MDGGKDSTGITIEHIVGLIVSDFVDGLSCDGLNIHIGTRLDLTGYHNKSGRTKGFTSHLGVLIITEELIEDGVRNLVCDLVRVTR